MYGWLFGFGYFVSNLYWISISLTFDQNLKFLIPLTIIIVPGFIALFYALTTYLFIVLKPKKKFEFIFSFFFNIWNNRIDKRINIYRFPLEFNCL